MMTEKGIIIGATIIVIGGLIDDVKDIKPYQKLLFQIAASIVLIICGLSISKITNPFGEIVPYINLNWFAIPLTIIWTVGVTNAFNLIDGLDGLAAGVACISSITIFIIAILNNRQEAAILTAILSGSILGFLPYNFNPASIFMGDTGSQLLGFLLAAISMEGAIKSATAFAIAVPILALGLPIYDTLFAVVRRKINGKPIMKADRGHLHHRLLDMGLTQRQTVLIMYLISAILGGISIIAMMILFIDKKPRNIGASISNGSYIKPAKEILGLLLLGFSIYISTKNPDDLLAKTSKNISKFCLILLIVFIVLSLVATLIQSFV